MPGKLYERIATTAADRRPEGVLMRIALSHDDEGSEIAAQALYSLYNGGAGVRLYDLGTSRLSPETKDSIIFLIARVMDGQRIEMDEEMCGELLAAHPHLSEGEPVSERGPGRAL